MKLELKYIGYLQTHREKKKTSALENFQLKLTRLKTKQTSKQKNPNNRTKEKRETG